MLSDLTLKLAVIAFPFGMAGYAVRNRYPRSALFLMSLTLFCVSSWILASTYELALQDKTHIISRHYGTFAKSDRPTDFTTSVWIHSVLGIVTLIAGVAGMVGAFVGREPRFKR